jgi:hypothetical protein
LSGSPKKASGFAGGPYCNGFQEILSFMKLLFAIGGGSEEGRPGMKNHQPRLRVVAWVLLNYRILLVRLVFPRANWSC